MQVVDSLYKLCFQGQQNLSRLLPRTIKVFHCGSRRLIVGRKPYDNYLVRTDPQTRKITTMFNSQTNVNETEPTDMEYETISKDRVPIKLGSIRELREEVMQVSHNGTSQLKDTD